MLAIEFGPRVGERRLDLVPTLLADIQLRREAVTHDLGEFENGMVRRQQPDDEHEFREKWGAQRHWAHETKPAER